jgi:protein O-mannosyl-transferase
MKTMRLVPALIALLAAAVLAYLPGVDGEFLLDDADLARNPMVTDPLAQGIRTWLEAPRPLAQATFAANYLAVGFDTRGWHLTNIAIHLAATLLAFMVARRILSRCGFAQPDVPALLTTGIFALHPLQSEAVAYLTQRSESLAAGLYLLALWLLIQASEAEHAARRWSWQVAAILVQVLALATKPTAATLPATWLLFAVLIPTSRGEPLTWWERAKRELPTVLPLLALSALFTWRGLGGTFGLNHAGFDIPGLPWTAYLATQARVIPSYLGLFLWPWGQCADRAFPVSASFLEPEVVLGGLLLVGLLVAPFLFAARLADPQARKAARAAAFGVNFFLLSLAPSSSVIPLLDPFAEHRVYLGLFGLALTIGAGLWAALPQGRRNWQVPGIALAVVLLLILGGLTAARARTWSSGLLLWADAARRQPAKTRVEVNLGKALFDAHRPTEALEAFRRAARSPEDPSAPRDDVLNNLVTALLATGRASEARETMQAELAAEPFRANSFALLAQVEFVSGRDGEAIRAAGRALSLHPGSVVALKYLGMTRLRMGDLEGARQALRQAATGRLLDPMIPSQLGAVEAQLGNIPGACDAYRQAEKLPGNPYVSATARTAANGLGCP